MPGSYPRPRWNGFDLGGADIRVALRQADFAEAFSDRVRAMIGGQVDAGIDVPTDGHLWYDRHEGLISSFLLYPAYHLDGIEVLPEANCSHRRTIRWWSTLPTARLTGWTRSGSSTSATSAAACPWA